MLRVHIIQNTYYVHVHIIYRPLVRVCLDQLVRSQLREVLPHPRGSSRSHNHHHQHHDLDDSEGHHDGRHSFSYRFILIIEGRNSRSTHTWPSRFTCKSNGDTNGNMIISILVKSSSHCPFHDMSS